MPPILVSVGDFRSNFDMSADHRDALLCRPAMSSSAGVTEGGAAIKRSEGKQRVS